MSDLISRDALIRDISEKIDISKAERAAAIKRGRYDDAYFYSGEVCIARRIRRYVSMFAPTVDAEPVVHARWVKDAERNTYCSHCETYIPVVHCYREYQDYESEWDEEIEETEFCPNCGAKMDKKEV